MKQIALRAAALLVAVITLLGALPLIRANAEAAYYVEVDITNQIVTVYDDHDHTESGIVAMMICSTGKSSGSTPVGTFTMPKKTYSEERTEWYYFPKYKCYAKWASRIKGAILFHSIPFDTKTSGPDPTEAARLGSPASHGCVRLRVEDAEWIAKNCLPGTKVHMYRSGKLNDSLRAYLLNKSWYRGADGEQSLPRGYLMLGDEGEEVASLQETLIALKLLASPASGVYDDETEAAVTAAQELLGLEKTGKADAALVESAVRKAQELTEAYPDGNYALVTEQVDRQMAYVDTNGYAKVYTRTSTAYNVIAKLKNKTVVEVLSVGTNWTRIQCGDIVGYVQIYRLKYYTEPVDTYVYRQVIPESTEEPEPSEEPANSPQPEITPEPTEAPTESPTEEPTPSPTDTPEPEASERTLKKGDSGADVQLLQKNLQELQILTYFEIGLFDDETEAAVRTAQRAFGISATGVATPDFQRELTLRVQELRLQYPDGYTATVTTTEKEYAIIATRSTPLNIRKSASMSSKVLGRAPKGARAEVIQHGSVWSRIQYRGVTGYCKNSYLSFVKETGTQIEYLAGSVEAPLTAAESAEEFEEQATHETDRSIMDEGQEDAGFPQEQGALTEEILLEAEPLEEATPAEDAENLQKD